MKHFHNASSMNHIKKGLTFSMFFFTFIYFTCLILDFKNFCFQKLYILGGEVVDSAQRCTHLIANKVTRTVKFLTAISVAKHIVTPEWLDESFKCQKFVGKETLYNRQAEFLCVCALL